MKEPNIRFQEFNDEWEVQLFGSYIKECNELTSDKTEYPLYSLTIEEGVVPKPERYEREHLITKEGDSYKIVPPNAFVYNPMNLRFGALKVNHEDFPVCVSGYYNVFFMGNEETLKFWENYLLTNKMLNYYYSIATGSLIEKLRVHFSQFVNIKKPLPLLEEQKKISNLFNNIDDVISAIETEIALWEEKKKGVMQKIFSQEVRFKKENGFDYSDWEEEEIGNLGKFIKGAPLSKADISEIGVPFILYGELYTTYSEVAYEIRRKTKAVVEEKYYSRAGDVVIPTSGESAEEISTATCVMKEGVILAGDLNIFRSDIIDGRIMSYILNYQAKNKIAKIAQGKSIVHVQAKELGKVKIQYPTDSEEQKKIAELLFAVDEVIHLKQRKLEKWKNIKKGLLQQMFV